MTKLIDHSSLMLHTLLKKLVIPEKNCVIPECLCLESIGRPSTQALEGDDVLWTDIYIHDV